MNYGTNRNPGYLLIKARKKKIAGHFGWKKRLQTTKTEIIESFI